MIPTNLFHFTVAVMLQSMRKKEKKRRYMIHQFFMGLDEARFGIICQGVIATDFSVDIDKAYVRVVREQQWLTSAKEQEAQHNAIGFVAKKEPSETNNSGQPRHI